MALTPKWHNEMGEREGIAAAWRDADGAMPARVRQILERIEAAIADTSKELRAYMKAHAEFSGIGNRMLQQWEQGVGLSLKAA